MIRQALSTETTPDDTTAIDWPSSVAVLALTGLATSIDAMAVGPSLAMVDVNIFLAAVIGTCTFAMVTCGILLGGAMGILMGKRAELIGGLILIGVGIAILHGHLSSA